MAKLIKLFQKYSPGLVRISSKDRKGDWSTGTGFHIGDGFLVTARHVVENRHSLEISPYRYGSPETVTAKRFLYPDDRRIDLAVIESDFSLAYYMRSVTIMEGKNKRRKKVDHIPLGGHLDDWIDDEFLLSKALLMGYPPVPTSVEPILVAVEGEVNAVVDRYVAPHPHFILSNTPRGGFSGGPVISEWDFLLGVATDALRANRQAVESGFTAVISVEPLLSLLADNSIFPGENGRHMRTLGFHPPRRQGRSAPRRTKGSK